jgi:hypothetical protein
MANTTQQELYNTFLAVAGGRSASLAGGGLAGLLGEVVSQFNGTNTTSAQPQSGGSTLETVVSTVLESGLGLVPLVGGLLGLFGGGGSETPPPLVKYALPASISFQGAETADGVGSGDYDQSGMPREYAVGAAAGTASMANLATPGPVASAPMAPSPAAAAPTAASSPQITVNVQAMDARSFLDRSSDIAAAVRDAMLNLNPINDVVNDL